ncbi:recombinase family protein [Methylobacterium mesophilicum]
MLFYTRYSTARQFELSTERQIEDSQKYLRVAGFELAENGIYSDEGRSGLYIVGREKLDALLERCRSENIRAVVIADPTRLSRDMVDFVWLHRKLARMGIELHSAASGRLDAAQVVLHGFLNQQQVQTLVHITRHARRAMVRNGKVPWGARTFGFERDGHVAGVIKACEAEVEIVRDIFRLSASGLSDVRIARILNTERRMGRRKNDWDDASVRRILNNPLYRGFIVLGRTKQATDPDTLAGTHTEVSPEGWEIGFAPHLVIVDEALWNSVPRRVRAPSEDDPARGRPDTFLLSGLVRCRSCKEHMTHVGSSVRGQHRFLCSNRRTKWSCDDGRSYDMGWVEAATLKVLASILDDPSLYEPYLMHLNREAAKSVAQVDVERTRLRHELIRLEREILETCKLDQLKDLKPVFLGKLLKPLQDEHEKVEKALAALASPRAAVDVAGRIRELGGLAEALRELSTGRVLDLETRENAVLAGAIRTLVKRVVPRPDPNSHGVEVEVALAEMAFYDPGTNCADGPFRVVRGIHVPPTSEEQRRLTGITRAEQILAGGNCTLDAPTWSGIRHLIPEEATLTLDGERRDGRFLVEAMLLALRIRRTYADLPDTYGSRTGLRTALHALVRSGAWDKIVPILRGRAPHLLDGVDTTKLDYYKIGLKRWANRPRGRTRPKIRPPVVALMRRSEGATLADIVKATGQRPASVRSLITRIRRDGVNVTSRRRLDGLLAYHAT